MFFFLSVASGKFATHVGINPSLREWQKSIAFLVTTAKTEDAKLTFKIISSRRNRPPNSRSSRLFPANSRTAPSPRYALSERFESFFLYHKKSSHNEKRRGENVRLIIAISDNVEFLSRLSLSRFSFGTESEDTDERGEKGSFLFGYFFARRGSRFINNMNTNSASSSGTSHRDQKLRLVDKNRSLSVLLRFFFCTPENYSLMETFYHFLRVLTFYHHQSIITNTH